MTDGGQTSGISARVQVNSAHGRANIEHGDGGVMFRKSGGGIIFNRLSNESGDKNLEHQRPTQTH